MIENIQTIEDVESFSRLLIAEGANFHPDDDFATYVNIETGEPTYTPEEAELRNALMNRAFEVCDINGVDIYNVTMEVFLKETGLDKYIPLPSQVEP